jgi:hypothetical protein
MTALGKAWHPERPHIRSRCCRAFALPMLLVLQHRGSMEISQEPPCLLLFHLYKGLALCATSCIWHESSGLPLHTCPRSGQPRTRKGFYGRLNVSVLVTECMRERGRPRLKRITYKSIVNSFFLGCQCGASPSPGRTYKSPRNMAAKTTGNHRRGRGLFHAARRL